MTSIRDMIKQWDEPVYVQVDMRSPQIIRDPADALAFLAIDWVGSRRKHEFAREICAAAMLGQVSSETARDAFAEAAFDARIVTCAPNSGA
ncbi:DUF982 domain-containing protein [Rhizobium leguminosarum]|nr:DUF982 domain-containing protein [Rhizobium leguminosarum]NKK59190.1 DUF982 domain-containing protein [Rhizobium leguminosarum bv. viciae]